MNVFHSSHSEEWGTPSEYVEAARKVLGGIDLDPASDAQWNETVKATFYFDEDDNGLEQEWFGNVWLNPPGGKLAGNKSKSGEFWNKLMREIDAGRVNHAIVAAFNLNALQQTQCYGAAMCHFPFCVPAQRVRWADGLTGARKAPPHASAFVYVPGSNDLRGNFKREFERFGAVCNGGI